MKVIDKMGAHEKAALMLVAAMTVCSNPFFEQQNTIQGAELFSFIHSQR